MTSNDKNSFLTSAFGIFIVALICNLFWGSAIPCVKIGYSLYSIQGNSPFSQTLFAGTRFILSGILTILIGSILNRRFIVPKKTSWHMVLKICLFQTILQYGVLYIGVANATGIISSIVVSANTFISIIITTVILKYEKLTLSKLLGCVIGLSGVILINLNGAAVSNSFKFIGEGLVFISAVSNAIAMVLVKKYSADEDVVALSGYQFIVGGCILVIFSLLCGGKLSPASPSSHLMLLYLAIVSSVAYSLWGILLKHNPLSKVAIYGFMSPVFGVFVSAVFLKEGTSVLGFKAILALILVCAGIFLVNRTSH